MKAAPSALTSADAIFLPQGHELRIVKGDAMAPTLRPDQPVIVDTTHRIPSPPGIYEIDTGAGTEFVFLEAIGGTPVRIRMWRDNAAYGRYELLATDISIVGRVKAAFFPL